MIIKFLKLFSTLVVILILQGVISQELSNFTTDDSGLTYTVTKRRTEIGRWITEIHFKHDETEDGPYEVQIKQMASGVCSQNNFVDVIVSVSGPSNKNTIVTQPLADYEFFQDVGYYKFHSTAAIWDQARKTCNIEGGHLVIINSITESKVINFIMEKNKAALIRDTALIGFHDQFVEGEYTTIFGMPLNSTGFYTWDTAQPDNAGGNENCGSVHRNGLLNDIPCNQKFPFICELKEKKIVCGQIEK